MTDMLDLKEAAVASEDSPAIAAMNSLGRCLSEARQTRGYSIAEVAQVIKYSPRQIEALENEQFDRLPGAVMVRGFIRNYAKLLQLDATGLLALYDKQAPTPPPVVELLTNTGSGAALPRSRMRHEQSHRGLMLGGAILLLVAALGIYFFWPATHSASESNAAVMPPSPSHVADQVADAAVTGQNPHADSAASSATPEQPPTVPQTAAGTDGSGEADKSIIPAASAGAALPLDADSRQLIFSFDGKSWVEVKDATHRTIFAQNNLPGTHQVVAGKPPFALVVGNASRVQLQYEDRSIDMQPHTRVDVARFNLE